MLRLFVIAVAGWWADQRQDAIAYLVEENRILRAHLRGRVHLTDVERRRDGTGRAARRVGSTMGHCGLIGQRKE
jgi:hypothetical protein